MRKLYTVTAVLLTIMSGAQKVACQLSAVDDASVAPGRRLAVALVVFGPGDALVSRFGHAALLIEDTIQRSAYLYSYGLSAQNSAGSESVRDMLLSDVLVHAEKWAPEQLLESYAAQDRSIDVFWLGLTADQKVHLRDIVEADVALGILPRTQDFYDDNCTTALRNVLNEATDGALLAATQQTLSARTRRWYTLQYTAADPILYLVLTLVIGRPGDEPLSGWDLMFLPDALADQLRGITQTDASGDEVSLITSHEAWYSPEHPTALADAPAWPLGIAIGLVLSSLVAVVARVSTGNRPYLRLACAAGLSAWLFALGAAGTALVVLWGFTNHDIAHSNENILLTNPLAMVAGWMILTGALDTGRGRKLTRGVAYLLAAGALIGLLMKASPGPSQDNLLLLMALAPPQVALALALRSSTRNVRT